MDEETLRKKLSPEEYHILREKGTERPFSGKYVYTKKPGVYECKVCGAALFSSEAKFDSGTGWPSFDDVISGKSVELRMDNSVGAERVEVLCKQCGSHLGHVFNDMPRKSKAGAPAQIRKRYCINSRALHLHKTSKYS